MISILKAILCAIVGLAAAIIDLMVMAFNGLIALIGTTLAAIVSLLPSMPSTPAVPDSGVLAFINWFIPLGAMLAACSAMLLVYALFRVFAIALRWFRAL